MLTIGKNSAGGSEWYRRSHLKMNRYTGKRKSARDSQLNRIRLFIGVVFVLFLIMCVLGVAQFVMNNKSWKTDSETDASLPENSAATAGLLVDVPESVSHETPELPEETLPIIITNTPTPTPSPTPTATPTPTPTPSPTPVLDLGSGVVNRESNLREQASPKAKIRKKVARNTAITIHEAIRDEDGNGWYFVTLDAAGTEGWLRDYLVTFSDGRKIDSFVPEPAEETNAAGDAGSAGEIGRAVTNRSTNVRAEPVQNGKIVRQISEGVRLIVFGYYQNDDAQWYEVKTESGKTHGYVRAYTVNVTELLPGTEMQPYQQEQESADKSETL